VRYETQFSDGACGGSLMKKMAKMTNRIFGQGLVEYGLILMLAIIIVIQVLGLTGVSIS